MIHSDDASSSCFVKDCKTPDAGSSTGALLQIVSHQFLFNSNQIKEIIVVTTNSYTHIDLHCDPSYPLLLVTLNVLCRLWFFHVLFKVVLNINLTNKQQTFGI